MFVALLSAVLLPACESRVDVVETPPEEPEGEEVAVLDEEEVVPEDIPEPDPDDDRTIEQRLRDASLAARVRIALVEERRLRAFDIETQAENGVVRLTGRLPSQEASDLAEQIAKVVQGVREVENWTEIPK